MVMHYAVYPSAREHVINFLVTVVPTPNNKLNRYNCFGRWQGLSGADFIGNEALRDLILFVQRLREWNGDGSEIDVRKMTEPVIRGIMPEFPLTLVSGGAMYNDWRARRKSGQRYERKNWGKVIHVALPSVVAMTSVAERLRPLIVNLIVRYLGNKSSMNPLFKVVTGLSIMVVPDWSTALTLSFV